MQNRKKWQLLLTIMNRNAEPENIRQRVLAHRARQVAAGRMAVNVFLPSDLIDSIDKIKEEKGASSRALIIEEALRIYIETKQGA